MIELAEFHASQQAGNQRLNMLPLFYKLSVDDLGDRSIEDRWMPTWTQYANDDKRIDVAKWSAAVRALRKVNGVIFQKIAMSEVAYRKDVVRSIFRLSPPELLYGSSRDMLGYSRICQSASSRFVEDARVGARVLGVYGMSGVGKSTLCKGLCDYLFGEFLGRVCYVDVGVPSRVGVGWHAETNEASRLRRVKLILERLCGFDKDALRRITDSRQGLKQLRLLMKRGPVFLAIDNVSNYASSWKEAHEYLTVGFHPESRIMITSRSEVIVQDLLPGVKFCMSMPRLSVQEAGAIFLRSAAPTKSICALTDEERRILGLCIQQCLFESDQDELVSDSSDDELQFLSPVHKFRKEFESYHPLALSALGDFFYRFMGNSQMLRWKDQLEKEEVPLKDMWKEPSIRSIIGLQFSALDPSEQLLFLDLTLSIVYWESLHNSELFPWSPVDMLCGLHEETPTVMKRKLRDLTRSGMMNFLEDEDDDDIFSVSVPALYLEFAEWYVTEHEVKGLRNAWGVFQASGMSLRCDPPASKCWSDLVRLRLFDLTRANARFVASKTMQELHNLVVLQLHSCTNLMELNLEGLESLRYLELIKLRRLVTVTLSGNSSTDWNVGIFESLQNVLLEDLDSLTHVPDVRLCTSLRAFILSNCQRVTNFEGVECPHLKELELRQLVPHQWARLPNVKLLHSLEEFTLDMNFNVDPSDVFRWFAELQLRELESPVFKILEEVLLDHHHCVEFAPPSHVLDRTVLIWSREGLGGIENLIWNGYQESPGRWKTWQTSFMDVG